jgi:rhombotail lipoprotein
MRCYFWSALALSLGLAGCADFRCFSVYEQHAQNSTSLVGFLYPNGAVPPPQDAQPELHLPLRVGLAFLPSNSQGLIGLDAAHKEALLQEVRKRFVSRKFIADIVIIPDYYLQGRRGFEGLEGVQRLYGVDLMALVSYDQIAHEDDNRWSLAYLTIVGAYVIKGTRHDLSTLVDLAVVDPKTHSLVIRAGGFDTRHNAATFIDENRLLRETSVESFTAATQQMIDHFDGALTAFEADVRDGKSNVKVVSNHGKPTLGGGGSLDGLGLALLTLLSLAAIARRERAEGNCGR